MKKMPLAKEEPFFIESEKININKVKMCVKKTFFCKGCVNGG